MALSEDAVVEGVWLDDEINLMAPSASLFSRRGVNLSLVSNVEELLSAVVRRDRPPQIVLLDLALDGDLDGLDVLQILKKLVPDMPVLIVSGHGDEPGYSNQLAAMGGSPDVLCKPLPMSIDPDFEKIVGEIKETSRQPRGYERSKAAECGLSEAPLSALALLPSQRLLRGFFGSKTDSMAPEAIDDLREHVRETLRATAINYVLDVSAAGEEVELAAGGVLSQGFLVAVSRSLPLDFYSFGKCLDEFETELRIAAGLGLLNGTWGEVIVPGDRVVGVPSPREEGRLNR